MKLILASQSPGRKEALEKAGFTFDMVPSNFEEDMTLKMPSHALAIHLSQGKARDVAAKFKDTDSIIIGADTFGVFEDAFMGKPHTKENSHAMLSKLSNNVHSMVTGITLIDARSGKEISRSVETKIWFREIPMEEIVAYADTEEGLKTAGAYKYQMNGRKFVERVEGSESNIMGMPVEVLREMLEEFPIT